MKLLSMPSPAVDPFEQANDAFHVVDRAFLHQEQCGANLETRLILHAACEAALAAMQAEYDVLAMRGGL